MLFISGRPKTDVHCQPLDVLTIKTVVSQGIPRDSSTT